VRQGKAGCQQAYILSFMDVFLILTTLFASLVLMTTILRKPKAAGGAGGGIEIKTGLVCSGQRDQRVRRLERLVGDAIAEAQGQDLLAAAVGQLDRAVAIVGPVARPG